MNRRFRLITALFACACVAATAAFGFDRGSPTSTECGKNHYILHEPPGCGWVPVGKLATARWGHTATRLDDGSVLVVGGTMDLARSVEIYDPLTRQWRPAQPLSRLRSWHTATLLHDGRVLVLGGDGDPGHGIDFVGTGEVFDPATGAWSPVTPMPDALSEFTASLLPDGRVMVVGGVDNLGNAIARVGIYDPMADAWSATASLHEARSLHTATVLDDGRVLVVGGLTNDDMEVMAATAELYDPSSATWRAVGYLQRRLHTATLLPDARVVITGGYFKEDRVGGFNITCLADSWIFDANAGAWTRTADLPVGRSSHTATLIDPSTLLVTGGIQCAWNKQASSFMFAFVPQSVIGSGDIAYWALMDQPNAPREGHTATLLKDGSVLVAGGWGGGDAAAALDTAELFIAH